MSSNQRARLVLNPLTLVAILLIAGVAAGASFLMFHRRAAHGDGTTQAAAARTSDIVLSSDEFDFGTLRADRTVVRQLLLRNHGTSPVRLRIDASGRVQAEPRSLEISTDAIGRVFLTARAGEPGPWEEEIRVVREGSSEAPMVVRLRGSNRAGAGGGAGGGASAQASGDVSAGGVDVAYVDAALPAGEADAARAPGDAAAPTSAPAGSVQITRTGAPGVASGSGSTDPSSRGGSAVQPPGGFVHTASRMSDRPVVPTSDAPEDGEEPSPIRRKTPAELDKKDKEPEPGVSALAISSSSTVNLMGTTNVFSPQQVVLVGSASGGSFSLLSPIQIPRIPLAFGQSMQFSQRGSAVGSYDAGSGQVVITIAVDSMDSTGHSAPFTVQLTTGTVVTRNSSGILVSATGQARTPGSGQLRLVGIGKIPEGYSSGAESELVTFDVIATLQFATPANDPSAASSGGL